MEFIKQMGNQHLYKAEGFLRLNLQFFAEGDPVPNDPPADPAPNPTPPPSSGGTDPTPQDPPKTFSQDDVNSIAAKEAKKAQEKLLKQLGIEDFNSAKEGLQKFKEWQESQKSEAEKQVEQLKQLETNFSKTQGENETLKSHLSAMKAGVNAESIEDVVTLAKNLVSDEVDMDQAIQKVLEKYPHFKQQEQPKPEDKKPSFSAGQHQKQPASEMDAWLNAFKPQ
ncbi:hypothetical protein [Bacillus sp. OTU530]|uniref:hypothetical protein n=1 Tax=Bacillus sp. OTU530 TaxID=3043862 RepID=UPI00313C5205